MKKQDTFDTGRTSNSMERTDPCTDFAGSGCEA